MPRVTWILCLCARRRKGIGGGWDLGWWRDGLMWNLTMRGAAKCRHGVPQNCKDIETSSSRHSVIMHSVSACCVAPDTSKRWVEE